MTVRLKADNQSELDAGADPEQAWRARRVERALRPGKLTVDRRERPRDERPGAREAGRPQLAGRVVAAIEHVVHLPDQLQPARQPIPHAGIDDGISRDRPGAEI